MPYVSNPFDGLLFYPSPPGHYHARQPILPAGYSLGFQYLLICSFNSLRAKCIRLLIVPRGSLRASAISWYLYPSKYRRNGVLNISGSRWMAWYISFIRRSVSAWLNTAAWL